MTAILSWTSFRTTVVWIRSAMSWALPLSRSNALDGSPSVGCLPVKLAPATLAAMLMWPTTANVNPVGCGSEGAQPDESATASEAQRDGVHAVPVALRIGAIETADDESHETNVQLDEVTKRRRVVVVHERWTREGVYHCSSWTRLHRRWAMPAANWVHL